MNTKIKVALGLLAGGSLIYFGFRKNKGKLKTFTAPDGNTYGENQLYRTFDNKVYKNGKEIHFNVPESGDNNSGSNSYEMNADKAAKNYKAVDHKASYHQKGNRHR